MNKYCVVLVLLWIGVACASNPTGDPAMIVEQYLQAKVARDATVIQRLLCDAQGLNYEREVHSFETVSDARLEGMECQQVGETDIVHCRGMIRVTYGAEQTDFPLTAYQVVWENGQWKWCGEAP